MKHMTKRILCAVCLVCGLFGAQAWARLPAEVLDLNCWKITLPYSGEREGHPLEISQPVLAGFENPTCFFVNETGDGVVFRANCTSISTKKSSYPRSELREMNRENPKKTKANWSTSDGMLHRMTVTEAITSVPPVKKHVVSAQLHDADDDVLMIRLEDKNLFIERNKLEQVVLDADYQLGTKFTIRMEAAGGRIKVWFNGTLKLDWEIDRSGCYFKAGCYTQSNPERGDSPESYGEVVIYKLIVEHLNPAASGIFSN
jgi:poly(beta-D-mannuronate) lyase